MKESIDAASWRSINRVGLPMIHPLFNQYNEDLGNLLNGGHPDEDLGTQLDPRRCKVFLEAGAAPTRSKGQKHSAKSRKAIGAAKRKWWKQRRALLKTKSKSS